MKMAAAVHHAQAPVPGPLDEQEDAPVQLGNPRLPTTGAYQLKRQQLGASHSNRSISSTEEPGKPTVADANENVSVTTTVSNRSRSLPAIHAINRVEYAAPPAGASRMTRRPSVASVTSRTSRFSISSIRTRISRTFSQSSVVEVDEPSMTTMPSGGQTLVRKASRKQLKEALRNKELEEAQLRAGEETARLEALALAQQLEKEEARAARVESALMTTAEEVDVLKERLLKLEMTLQEERLAKEEAQKKIKEVERDIVDERAAAEKVYRMFVDLSCEVASSKVELPNMA